MGQVSTNFILLINQLATGQRLQSSESQKAGQSIIPGLEILIPKLYYFLHHTKTFNYVFLLHAQFMTIFIQHRHLSIPGYDSTWKRHISQPCNATNKTEFQNNCLKFSGYRAKRL
ncbi:hypothetical protein KC19_2G173100 [Ceratodon purpureus]|uniref:Uncharacterized protein n=1 Tax=Ceratodon purpureus TaxID=3225 RepID=A0A8T0IWK9_CERPU|nr:hypothetical protein KC19_2G173100 [Ceratodon purpureus]